MHHPTSLRLALSLAVSLVLPWGLGGCGGTSPGYPTPAALFRAIGARAVFDQTVAFTMTATGTGPVAADQAITTVDGELRVQRPVASVSVTGRTQAGAESPVDLRFVSLPESTYVLLPPAARRDLPSGKAWVRVSDGGTDPTSERFSAMVAGIRDVVSPVAQLARYVDAMTIQDTATEPVEGARCTRYGLRVDLEKTAAIATDPRVQATARQLMGTGMRSYEATVWADDQDRIHSVVVSLGKPTDRYGYATEVRYHDWGKPVHLEAPPSDQVSIVS